MPRESPVFSTLTKGRRGREREPEASLFLLVSGMSILGDDITVHIWTVYLCTCVCMCVHCTVMISEKMMCITFYMLFDMVGFAIDYH